MDYKERAFAVIRSINLEREDMNTKILDTDENSIKEAGKIIAGGGLVAFPTETVYGLGADAFDSDAAAKIYEAKGRPSDNPLIVHISDKSQIDELSAGYSEKAKKLIDAFMPGPFTIILKKSERVPDGVTACMDTVGIRFPEIEIARRFIAASGVPVAAPSANISGKPSPTTARDVMEDMQGRIDAIIDGGDCEVGVESTIVDATGETPVVLRPGGITYDEICAVVPDAVIDPHILESLKDGEQPKCPGMKYKHYAPEAEVYVVEGNMADVKKKITELVNENEKAGKICGVLTMSENAYDGAVILQGGMTNKEYAKGLFANLREFDRLKVDIVYAEFEERDGYGLAVKNRLYKSAGQRVIYV